MSNASIALPVRPYSGFEMRSELWRCNAAGEIDPDGNLTDYLIDMTVSVNWLDGIKMSLRLSLKEPAPVIPLRDRLMPRMIVSWHDEQGFPREINEPLGVYDYLMPDQDATETILTSHIEGMDGLYRLGQITSDTLQWIDKDKDFGEEAYKLLFGKAPMPLSLPRTGIKSTKPRTIRPNDRLIDHVTQMYGTADFWDLAPERNGTMKTFQRTVLGRSEPGRIIDARLGDVIGNVQLRPDREAFCNQVFLSSNSPEAALTLRDGYRISFVDPASPWSVPNIGVIAKELADSRDESFPTMQHRAMMMLETAAGLEERITIPVFPDPRFDIREVWQLFAIQADGNILADGLYRVEQMEFGMVKEAVAQVVTLSHLVNTDEFFVHG